MFSVLEADPPWKFGDSLPGDGRGAVKHYPCMTADEICRFGIPRMESNSVLFLWRVASMQQEALDVMNAWGFELKSEIVWEKLTANGIGIQGKWKPTNRSTRSRFAAKVGRHSEKPSEFYDLVEAMTNGPRARLFARSRREGWTSFGNELESAAE